MGGRACEKAGFTADTEISTTIAAEPITLKFTSILRFYLIF
jgi:hypothetical protein